jgi:hypothetical protein
MESAVAYACAGIGDRSSMVNTKPTARAALDIEPRTLDWVRGPSAPVDLSVVIGVCSSCRSAVREDGSLLEQLDPWSSC